MRNGHAFRPIGIAVAVVIALSLAGCGALGGGGGGGGCGPGDTGISSVAGGDMSDRQEVTFTGEIVAMATPEAQENPRGNSHAIDDGTGTAFVPGVPDGVEEGDCVTVEGVAYPNTMDAGADVIVSPTNATVN